jgi:hypothetical protein
MSVLPSHTPLIKQFYLPSSAKDAGGNAVPQDKQDWVKMDVGNSLTGDVLLFEDTDSFDIRYIKLLASRIKEWSYVEADGTPAPINFDSITRLYKPDYFYLVKQQMEAASSQTAPELPPAEKKS